MALSHCYVMLCQQRRRRVTVGCNDSRLANIPYLLLQACNQQLRSLITNPLCNLFDQLIF